MWREREVFVHLVADDDGVVARGVLGDLIDVTTARSS